VADKKPKKKKIDLVKTWDDDSTFEDDEDDELEEEQQQTSLKDDDDSAATMFGFLVKDLNKIDIQKTYETLKKKIQLGKDRLKPDVLSEAIDEAPHWAFTAAQLHIMAKEKLSKFDDLTFKFKYAALAEKATEMLERKKKTGKLSGQITKEKVENWILLNEPEYQQLLKEKRELEAAVEAFKSLSSQFESKKSLLQTQGRLVERKIKAD
jgi:hypothetical protein